VAANWCTRRHHGCDLILMKETQLYSKHRMQKLLRTTMSEHMGHRLTTTGSFTTVRSVATQITTARLGRRSDGHGIKGRRVRRYPPFHLSESPFTFTFHFHHFQGLVPLLTHDTPNNTSPYNHALPYRHRLPCRGCCRCARTGCWPG
jgi:hypothetical protein